MHLTEPLSCMYGFLKSRGNKNTNSTRKTLVTMPSKESDFLQTFYAEFKTTMMLGSHEAPGHFMGPVRATATNIPG